MRRSPWLVVTAAVVAVGTLAKLHAAATWGLLADEAYYWVWSHQLAWGYFDQPPAIAAWLAGARAIAGDGELSLRAGGILLGALAPLSVVSASRDRAFWLLWGLAAPPLAWLTLFATPDALLLGAWTLGLGAALRERWVWVGFLGGLATLCKLTGVLLVPLLLVAVGRQEWQRSRWALLGAVTVPAPYILWNVQHDWVSVWFPLSENLLGTQAPGLIGPPLQLLLQLAVMTPPLAVMGAVWIVQERAAADRVDRIAWWTSAPVLLIFAVAALAGPPEAHWPAPAWVGLGLGLSRASGRLLDTAWVCAWLALFASCAVWLHGYHPLAQLPKDPATRLTEGPVVAEIVGRWTLPAGVGAREAGVVDAMPVLTERYQEAAFIHYYLGVPASKVPGCGRRDQYDLWAGVSPEQAIFVKPSTGGEVLCTDGHYSKGPRRRRHGEDRPGRIVGVWDVWELTRVR